MIRRVAIGLFGTAVGAGLLAVAARANELDAASAGGRGMVIHDAASTLRDYCRVQDGKTWLVLPGGAKLELVTSIDDPAIVNPGDGQFHPFDEAEVRSALAATRFPLRGLSADVFLLPYPRRGGLESAAGPRLVLLSPGVRPLSREQQHAEFVHELGHVVQYARMPDADLAGWNVYRRLRGIGDTGEFSATGLHANRPHEIFAEDFRALFGDALANYSGTIENSEITPPALVLGLDAFMLELAATASLRAVSSWPNPSRGPIRFARRGGEMVPLDLFDVNGRLVATLDPALYSGGMTWLWHGRDRAGSRVRGGVVFARPREPEAATLRVTLIP